ncbi:hypothetical protein F511_30976 [Dorcoceras hygrometricum]|uniref:Dystroglycan-like n=1 Tax=Dorcoceras hygrometricum TaxID=472368 RepID=A0A2Z7CQI0_9LAMI|nr:hypothetical protein F511_30976 [Dorcoceras hygrometricum]
MAVSFSVNTLQVDFESVFAMEPSGMVERFKTLESTGLKGFLTATGSMYEATVGEFFANAKVISGTIVSFVANRKLALSKEMFAEAFGLPTEGMVGFLDIPKETAGSFGVVTSEKFDLMVAIPAGLKVNWSQILFNTFLTMVNNRKKQSQGYAVQISIMLENIVKTDFGESAKLHPQKVLTGKSVATYIKKNLKVTPAGESSKQTKDTASNIEGGGHERTDSAQDEHAGGNPGCDSHSEREQSTADGLEGETTDMMFVFSPPVSPHTVSKLEEVEKIVSSLDSRIMFIDSRMLSTDSKVKTVDYKLGSMDSKIDHLLNLQSYIKHDIGTSGRSFYDKLDTVAANLKTTQTSLETTSFIILPRIRFRWPVILIILNSSRPSWFSRRLVMPKRGKVVDRVLVDREKDQAEKGKVRATQEVNDRARATGEVVKIATYLREENGFEHNKT